MKLRPKQKRFADEYIITGNATEAARRAGYSEKTCSVMGDENLRKPNIKKYIDDRMAQLEDATIAKEKEVLQYLTAVLRGESSSEIVVVEGIGDGASEARRMEKAPDEKERLKAAELLGKRYRLFVDKQEVQQDVQVTFVGENEIPE